MPANNANEALIFNMSSLGMNNFREMLGNGIGHGTDDVVGNFIPCLTCSDMISFVNIFFDYTEQLFTNTVFCRRVKLEFIKTYIPSTDQMWKVLEQLCRTL